MKAALVYYPFALLQDVGDNLLVSLGNLRTRRDFWHVPKPATSGGRITCTPKPFRPRKYFFKTAHGEGPFPQFAEGLPFTTAIIW